MNTLQQIKYLEDQISVYQKEIARLKSLPQGVKRGDLVTIIVDKEWVCSKGTVMWVDSVSDGYIHVRSPNPKERDSGLYWISNGQFVKND